MERLILCQFIGLMNNDHYLDYCLRSKSMPYGKVLTLRMRAGVCGAFQDKSWSFLVPVEAMNPGLFLVDG